MHSEGPCGPRLKPGRLESPMPRETVELGVSQTKSMQSHLVKKKRELRIIKFSVRLLLQKLRH